MAATGPAARSAANPSAAVPARAAHAWIERVALLLLCSAYLEGGLAKAADFTGAVGEMQHFGLAPAPLFALGTIALELLAPLMVVIGRARWLGALSLAAFTLGATLLANRFWTMAGAERFAATNAFFEHLGLAGAFVLVAWHDLGGRRGR